MLNRMKSTHTSFRDLVILFRNCDEAAKTGWVFRVSSKAHGCAPTLLQVALKNIL